MMPCRQQKKRKQTKLHISNLSELYYLFTAPSRIRYSSAEFYRIPSFCSEFYGILSTEIPLQSNLLSRIFNTSYIRIPQNPHIFIRYTYTHVTEGNSKIFHRILLKSHGIELYPIDFHRILLGIPYTKSYGILKTLKGTVYSFLPFNENQFHSNLGYSIKSKK